MTRPPTRWRAAVALAAAYALVLQAFLLAPGARAGGSGLAAAHVLCLPSGGAADLPAAPGAPADPGHDGCCVLCAASGAGLGAVPTEIGPPVYGLAAGPRLAAAAAPARVKAERSPIVPRAPPRAA